MSQETKCVKKCSLTACRHFGIEVTLTTNEPFECERGIACPVLHPRPWWQQRWIQRRLLLGACVLILVSAWLIGRAVQTAYRPQILNLSYNPFVQDDGLWQGFVEAGGETPLTYQWYKGYSGDTSDPIETAKSSRCDLSNVKSAFHIWVQVSNRFGTVNSPTLNPKIAFTIEKIDYDRELDELAKLGRRVLELTDSVRVFDEQLHAAYAPMDRKSVTDWEKVLRVKMTEREETVRALIEKFKYLASLDTVQITRHLQEAKPWGQGVEQDRQQKTASYLSLLWKRVMNTQELTEAELIGEASKVDF